MLSGSWCRIVPGHATPCRIVPKTPVSLWGSRGRGFESRRPDHLKPRLEKDSRASVGFEEKTVRSVSEAIHQREEKMGVSGRQFKNGAVLPLFRDLRALNAERVWGGVCEWWRLKWTERSAMEGTAGRARRPTQRVGTIPFRRVCHPRNSRSRFLRRNQTSRKRRWSFTVAPAKDAPYAEPLSQKHSPSFAPRKAQNS